MFFLQALLLYISAFFVCRIIADMAFVMRFGAGPVLNTALSFHYLALFIGIEWFMVIRVYIRRWSVRVVLCLIVAPCTYYCFSELDLPLNNGGIWIIRNWLALGRKVQRQTQ